MVPEVTLSSPLESCGLDPEEAKLHVPHCNSLRSRLVDPVILAARNLRFSSVPSGVMLVACVFAFMAGSFIQTADLLPSPGGPQVSPDLYRQLQSSTASRLT